MNSPTRNGLFQSIRRRNINPLYVVSLLIFFYALFDGGVSFIVPIAITKIGLSKTAMGIIVGSSSVLGALFDFLISKVFKNTHFRRVYLLMFICCFLCLFFLWSANTITLFLIVMAFWGFYFDLSNFGSFDFISRRTTKLEHSHGFGVLWVFRSLGVTLAPLIIGLAIVDTINWQVFALMGIFISISFGFFCLLSYLTNHDQKELIVAKERKQISVLLEIKLWRTIGKFLLPVLLMSMLIWITDSFFWTIGPLMSESLSELNSFKGLFLTAYTLPPLITGWFVGRITNRYGKKKTAFYSLGVGALLLSFLTFINNPFMIIGLVFLSSCFFAISLPAISGAYADYIGESPELEKEVTALEDFFTNIGYIVGPITAGILADSFGNASAFSILGIVEVFLVLILLKLTPKKIKITGIQYQGNTV